MPEHRQVDAQLPVVVALGGNSLLVPGESPTVAHQFEVTAAAMAPVAALIKQGVRVVVTHGNGPQVGFMQRRSELAAGEVHAVPLDALVANTQGSLGYMIQRGLRYATGCEAEVATVVTEVVVDHNDAAFGEPTKPIGRFYTEAEAKVEGEANGWDMVEDAGRGWRRVVASPGPIEIVQLRTIKRLVEAGVTVIACGGGGIPVERVCDGGHLMGYEAVIDKDRTSALLANGLGSKHLVITTGVEAVFVDFLSDNPKRLDTVSMEALRGYAAEGQFPPGSMGPKVEAALWFLERGGETVTICRPEDLVEAYAGRTGTRIQRDT